MDNPRTSQTKKRIRRPKALWIILGVAALLAVVSTLTMGKAMPSTSRNNLWVDTARQGDMLREIRATGTLVPRSIRWISAGSTATVQSLLVQAGATVKADTIIMQLSNPATESGLAKARAALAESQAELDAKRTGLASDALDHTQQQASAESAYEVAKIKTKALEAAEQKGAVSRIDVLQSQIGLAQDKRLVEIAGQRVAAFREHVVAQMRAEQAACDQAASALAIAQQDADSLKVRAGIDGILQQVSVDPGQQVVAGANLARVAQPDQLIARLSVPEVQAKDLGLDLPVTIDTHNGTTNGKITRIDPAVHQGSVVVDVAIVGALPPGARPDLSVDGLIVLSKLHDVISIGRPALATAFGESSLFVERAGSRVAKRVKVNYGVASSDRIEVRGGLSPGDQVILSDTTQWDKYDALRIE